MSFSKQDQQQDVILSAAKDFTQWYQDASQILSAAKDDMNEIAL